MESRFWDGFLGGCLDFWWLCSGVLIVFGLRLAKVGFYRFEKSVVRRVFGGTVGCGSLHAFVLGLVVV